LPLSPDSPFVLCQDWLDELPVYYLVLTPHGRIATMTRRLREALGYDAEELWDLDFAAKFFPPDIRKAIWPHFLARVLTSDEPSAERLPMITRAGRTLDVEWRFWARRGEDGRVTQLEGLDVDATSNRDSQRFHLSSSSLERKMVHLHESLLEYVADHVVLTDQHLHILYVNRAFETVSGFPREQALGKRISEMWQGRIDAERIAEIGRQLAAGNIYRGEFVNRNAAGELYYDELSVLPLRSQAGELKYFLAVGRDATTRRLSDPITGLQTRALLLERTRLAIARSLRATKPCHFALLFLDIDRFKVINDTYGMPVGDQVILEISRRLNTAVRQVDAVGQIGHLNRDEFAVLVEDLSDPADARVIADRILELVRKPIIVDSNELVLSVSIGIASSAPHYTRPEELLRDAETAMSLAKQNPTESCWIFDPTLREKSIQRTKLGVELRRALETDELCPYFQPIVSVHSGEITGAEALVRWRHPTRGLVSPLEFIPAAEESGLIVPLGLKVMRDASRQIVEWHREGFGHLSVAVNVSARQFRDRHFVESVERVIQETGILPRALKIELTESTAADDPAAVVKILEHLKRLGIQTLMDDFGTGYSSLNYLTRLPLDKLKIDRSFIMRIPGSAHDSLVTSTILVLAHNLGLGAIAEGVETEEQLAFLRDLSCDEFQGYLFSPPVTAVEFGGFLRNRYTLDVAVARRRAFLAERATRSTGSD
jgi:diguanylate cyclase (GGDEF)-like protein/PAS domain S-box-containing protein